MLLFSHLDSVFKTIKKLLFSQLYGVENNSKKVLTAKYTKVKEI